MCESQPTPPHPNLPASMHSGVFGAHRNAKATHKEVVQRYWWPSLKPTVVHTLRWLARSLWKCRSVLGTTLRCRPLVQSVTDRRSVRATGSQAVGWSRDRDATCYAYKRRGRLRNLCLAL